MHTYNDTLITRVLALVFFLCVASYALFEARWMIVGPQITVTADTAPTSSRTVLLTGSTLHSTSLSINGAPITVTQAGDFAELYALSPGVNIFYLDAKDRYGRTTHTKTVIVSTATSSTILSLPVATSSIATSTVATTTASTTHLAVHNEHARASSTSSTTSVVQYTTDRTTPLSSH